MKICDKKTREEWIHKKHMKAFNFYKERDFKEVDIIVDSPVSFKQAKKGVVHIKVDNIRINLIVDLVRNTIISL